MVKSEKMKRLEGVINQFNRDKAKSKNANKARIGIASDILEETEFVKSSMESLNVFIGGGKSMGFPRGGITVIGGAKGTAKTRMLLETIKQNQIMDPEFVAGWVDAEGAMSADACEDFGVDMERFFIIDSGGKESIDMNTAEEMLTVTMNFMKAKVCDMIVVDSIAALCPKGELEDTKGRERTIDDQQVALQARVLSKFLRMSVGSGTIKKSNVAFIFIAQVRSDIGSYGGGTSVVGGNAVKHYSSLTIEQRRGALTDEYKESRELGNGKSYTASTGFPCVFKITKTRLGGNETSQTVIPFMFDGGFDELSTGIEALITSGLIDRKGGWYYFSGFPGGKLQGKPTVYDFFKEQPELVHELLINGISEESEGASLDEALAEDAVSKAVMSEVGKTNDTQE
jgi:recombination protein RecA